MYWSECKTTADLWEAARSQHLIMCITRSLNCNTDRCKTCGWHQFDEKGWEKTIEEERIKRGIE